MAEKDRICFRRAIVKVLKKDLGRKRALTKDGLRKKSRRIPFHHGNPRYAVSQIASSASSSSAPFPSLRMLLSSPLKLVALRKKNSFFPQPAADVPRRRDFERTRSCAAPLPSFSHLPDGALHVASHASFLHRSSRHSPLSMPCHELSHPPDQSPLPRVPGDYVPHLPLVRQGSATLPYYQSYPEGCRAGRRN